ncbi:MAG: hypothetical protein HY000_03355 [Planctomycetes bacterium]|nr:hypothetical protein [Planctomycetota bacterium]
MATNANVEHDSVSSVVQPRSPVSVLAAVHPPRHHGRLARSGLLMVAAAVAGSLLLAGNQPSVNLGKDESRAGQSDDGADYVATSLLRIAFREPRLLSDRHDAYPASRDEFEMYRRTQSVLLKSVVILGPALGRPEVADLEMLQRHQDDPVAWLAEALEVDFPGDAEILRISLRGDNAKELPTLVNAVVDAFLREVADGDQTRQLRRIQELEKLLAQSEQTIQTKRSTLKELAERLGTTDSKTISLRHRGTVEYYVALQSEHTRVRIELMRAQARLKVQQAAAKSNENAEPAESAIEAQIDSDPTFRQTLDQVARFKGKISEAERVTNRKDHPSLERLREQLVSIQESLAARRTELRPLITETLRAKAHRGSEPASVRIQEEIDVLTELERTLHTELERNKNEMESTGRESVELEFLRKEVEHAESVYNRAISELTNMRVEIQSPRRITVWHRATVSKTKKTKG